MATIITLNTQNPVGAEIHQWVSMIRATGANGESIRDVVAELGSHGDGQGLVDNAGVGPDAAAAAGLRDLVERTMRLFDSDDTNLWTLVEFQQRVFAMRTLMATVVPSNT